MIKRLKEARTGKMATEIEDIKVEINQLFEKIARRIEKPEKQLEGEAVRMYRHDLIISEAVSKIRDLYHKGEEICARYHPGEKTCRIFKDEPVIIRRLELSKEKLSQLRNHQK